MKPIARALAALVVITPVFAQPVTLRNPNFIVFTCQDHDRDDEHEAEIVDVRTGGVVQTMLLGDPPLTGSLVIAEVNLRPLAFGSYVVRVRAVANGQRSETSDPSPVWERAPGKPLNVDVR